MDLESRFKKYILDILRIPNSNLILFIRLNRHVEVQLEDLSRQYCQQVPHAQQP